jgi:DNA ligase 1
MKIAYRVDPSVIDWRNFKYVVFDTPNRNETYEQRYTYLGKYKHNTTQKNTTLMRYVEEYFRGREGGGCVEVARREVCRDSNHMDVFLQDVLDGGGEGIILRDPSSLYTPGRSPGFLKHKVSIPLQTLFSIDAKNIPKKRNSGMLKRG